MKHLDAIAYTVFSLLILVLSWNTYTLKQDNQTLRQEALEIRQTSVQKGVADFVSAREGRTLPAVTLPYIDGAGEHTLLHNDKHHLFILFTITDCSTCFTEVPFWSELETTFSDEFDVVGVITGNTPEQGAYFSQLRGISIPLVYDQEGVLFDAVDLKNSSLTPVKILVDAQGRVLHLGRTTYNRVDVQAAYRDLVQSLVVPEGRFVGEQVSQALVGR